MDAKGTATHLDKVKEGLQILVPFRVLFLEGKGQEGSSDPLQKRVSD